MWCKIFFAFFTDIWINSQFNVDIHFIFVIIKIRLNATRMEFELEFFLHDFVNRARKSFLQSPKYDVLCIVILLKGSHIQATQIFRQCGQFVRLTINNYLWKSLYNRWMLAINLEKANKSLIEQKIKVFSNSIIFFDRNISSHCWKSSQ